MLIAFKPRDTECFRWPVSRSKVVHVGETLIDLMALNGWDGAEAWAERAAGVGPTIVGGSKDMAARTWDPRAPNGNGGNSALTEWVLRTSHRMSPFRKMAFPV